MRATIKKLKENLIPIYGKGETDAIIRIIFHYLKGWNLTDMLIHQDEELSPFIKEEIEKILRRLLNHEPIQYITGEARFHGMNLKVAPGVLIPRPETEELVDIIIDENRDIPDLKVLDLATGSGCIAIALAKGLPFSDITAVDISPDALKIAEENSISQKVRIKLENRDILEWLPDDNFDIIVSNPPYVLDKEALNMDKNVLDYEPHEALFVRDENPLIFYSKIENIAQKTLKPGGRLYFEINPLTAETLKELTIKNGFSDVSIERDSRGTQRFLKCKWE